METNLHEHASDNPANPGPLSSNLNGASRIETSLSNGHGDVYGELRQLRLEVERLRDQQTALQRTPQPHESDIGNDAEEEKADSSEQKDSCAGIRMRRHPVRLMLSLVGAALLCVGGLRLWNYMQSYEWTDDAEIEGHLDPISTRIDGTVVHVYVENTYHVKKGQPLADLDPRDYQVAVEDAAANLAQAQQGVKAAQQNYDLSVANLTGAIATNAKAQTDVARYRELLAKQVIARESYDEIVRVGKVDAAAVNSDRAALAAAARMIGQAKAAVQAAQASLDQARLNLSYTRIVAPTSGVVGDKTVQVGQRVQPGQQLLTVVPLNNIWITADFRETQLRRMHPGQPATIHVDTTGRNYKGYIEGMPAATGELFSLLPPENATGNYVKVVQRLPVRIRLDPGQDPDHRLRPGMSVEPTVWINGRPTSLW
jgi:membrane fusion protein (multidrug efflux system)